MATKFQNRLLKLEKDMQLAADGLRRGLLSKAEYDRSIARIKKAIDKVADDMEKDRASSKVSPEVSSLSKQTAALDRKIRSSSISAAQAKAENDRLMREAQRLSQAPVEPKLIKVTQPSAAMRANPVSYGKESAQADKVVDAVRSGKLTPNQGKKEIDKIRQNLPKPVTPADTPTIKGIDKKVNTLLSKAKSGTISKVQAEKEIEALKGSVEKIVKSEKSLLKSVGSKEAQLRKLDREIIALEKSENAAKAIKKQIEGAKSLEELEKIDKQLSSLKNKAIIPKAAMSEVKAADNLADELQKGGLRLKKKLPKVAQEIMDKPNYTLLELRDAISQELIKESGKMYKPMTEFLDSSLGSEFKGLAKADFGIVYGSADDIIPKLVLHGAQEASEYSGTLSKFVLKQVDDTQSASPYAFTRHVEAGACKWCHTQVSVYETTRQFFRHNNCRCMKIRK